MLSVRTHVGVDGTDLRYTKPAWALVIGGGDVYLLRGMPRYESKSHV